MLSLQSYQKAIKFPNLSLSTVCHKQIAFHNPIKTRWMKPKSHPTSFFSHRISYFTLKYTTLWKNNGIWTLFHVDFNTSMARNAFGPQRPWNKHHSFFIFFVTYRPGCKAHNSNSVLILPTAQPFPLIYRFYLENNIKGEQNDSPHGSHFTFINSTAKLYTSYRRTTDFMSFENWRRDCRVNSYLDVSDMDHSLSVFLI